MATVNLIIFQDPWTAALVQRNGMNSILRCSGTIIDERYIITAAHCVYGVNLKNYKAVVGSTDATDITESTRLEFVFGQQDVIIHPQYQVCILKLLLG